MCLMFFAFSVNVYSQPIYLGLNYGMSKKEAKNEFKANNDLYSNVDIGNGFAWMAYQQNFIYGNEGLVGVLFSPKGGALGLSHQNTISYLEFTRAFFEKLGYTLFFEPDYWQYPENFNSKYGLILVNPDKTVVVQMYPFKQAVLTPVTYTAYLKVLNYVWFMDEFEKENRALEMKQQSTGF